MGPDAQPEVAGAGPPSGPPLSGITVMIDGMAVPKEKAIVIIHIGHSNMSGRAQGPAELVPYFYNTDPHLWKYTKGGVWTPAKEWLNPDGAPDKNFPQGAGPGMALLRQALSLAPDAYIISIGNGQSLNNGGGCFNFRKGGLYFPQVMERAGELKGKATFAGVFAMFGYDGRTNPRAQNGGYLECLKGLAADYRAELGEPNLPFAFGDYERGAKDGFSPTCCGAPQVIAQLAKVPEAIPHAILVSSEGVPMQDNHHYNMAGHKLWSERAFARLAELDLLPWATVPTVK
jgi:Carbohydrate esterase, sialic acid-specific acetylesterase